VGEGRNAYRVLMWIPEGNRALEKPRYRWEHNIKMDLKETQWEGVGCIKLAQWTR
jgi:hypothetical protein